MSNKSQAYEVIALDQSRAYYVDEGSCTAGCFEDGTAFRLDELSAAADTRTPIYFEGHPTGYEVNRIMPTARSVGGEDS